MENKLRGAVLSKYPTITAFAQDMKWDRKKASRIVNHVQNPSVEDLYKMSDTLGVSDCESFVAIFLPSLTTKWDS